MSLVTRCPACNTFFKVVADQLRISDGWVRCGRCEEVFDASLYLQPPPVTPQETPSEAGQDAPVLKAAIQEEMVSSAPQTSASASASAPAETLRSSSEDPLAYSDEPEADHDSALNLIFPDTVQIAPEPEMRLDFPPQQTREKASDAMSESSPDLPPTEEAAAEHVLSGLTPGGKEPVETVPVEQEATPDFSQHLADAMAQREAPSLDLSVPLGGPESVLPPMIPDSDGVSFMKSTGQGLKKPPDWLKPLQSLSVVGLMLLLGLQVTRHLRDEIASAWPATRPGLEQLCKLTQCEVQALRLIDAVVIESSSFTKVQGDYYRLQLTLKNTAAVPVAAPSLELALTDFHDQSMLRRVVSAKEMNTLPTELGPGVEQSVDISMQFVVPAQSERITGYKLLVFYP